MKQNRPIRNKLQKLFRIKPVVRTRQIKLTRFPLNFRELEVGGKRL